MKRTRRTNCEVDALLARLLGERAARGCCLWSTAELSDALAIRGRAGLLVSPRRGLYADAELWAVLDVRQRHLYVARSIYERYKPAAFCGITAAFAYGLSVTTGPAFGMNVSTINVASDGGAKGCRSAGTRWFSLGKDAIWLAENIPVTSPARTVFDCIRSCSFPAGLALADSALRLGYLKDYELAKLVEERRGSKGIARARLVLEHMDGRAESGGESVLRARMIELGYAVPELQICFDNPLDPSTSYRVDLLSRRKDGSCVAIELDGRQKYQDEKMLNGRDVLGALLDERQREAALTACGLEIMRVRWSDLLDDARLRRLMDVYRIPNI